MNEQNINRDRVDRRKSARVRSSESVRLFILDAHGTPMAERFCAGVDQSPSGMAIRTPGSLDPGVRVIVVSPTGEQPDIWLACVNHVRICDDGSRILGLERLEMCATIAQAPWLATLRAVA